MPVYNYKCQKCGHKFEGTAKMMDPCPSCPKVWPIGTQPFEVSIFSMPLVISQMFPENGGEEGYLCGGETAKDFNWGKSPSVQFNGGGWAKDGYSK